MQLSNKDIRILNQQIAERYHQENVLPKKARIEQKDIVVYRDGVPILFWYDELLLPTLKFLAEKENEHFLPSVVVDTLAIPFIANGADVMRPGIVEHDEFDRDAIVVVVDETHHKPLAVGRAVFSAVNIRLMDKGKVIAVLHHVGDDIWKK